MLDDDPGAARWVGLCGGGDDGEPAVIRRLSVSGAACAVGRTALHCRCTHSTQPVQGVAEDDIECGAIFKMRHMSAPVEHVKLHVR